jgi:hypothetical protein
MPRPTPLIIFVAMFAILIPSRPAVLAADRFWTDLGTEVRAVRSPLPGIALPVRFRTFEVDIERVRARLATMATGPQAPGVEILLPLPDGRLARFLANESVLLGPEVRRALPEIRTYGVRGVDGSGAAGCIDLTRLGLRGYIVTSRGTVLIEPLEVGRTDRVISFWSRDEARVASSFECTALDGPGMRVVRPGTNQSIPIGDTLRTYRYTLCSTGEYTEALGGDTLVAMAQMATTVNRMSFIYERELAIRLEAVWLKAWPNAATDPYDVQNNMVFTVVERNTPVVDSLWGSPNYDCGQLIHRNNSPNGGGLAFGSVLCFEGAKAGCGTDGANVNGTEYLRVMMHELGHVFSAMHTWDAPCNRFNGYEPWSGSTIMGRAGRCNPYNIQAECDHYFHFASQREILSYVRSMPDCGTATATGNSAPTAEAGADYTIPRGTPFVLTGSGFDGDPSDTLSYCWEQIDRTSTPFDSILGPLFRSNLPSLSPIRHFPELNDVLTGSVTQWNRLPNADRSLKFMLTVRGSNSPGVGGHAVDSMGITVSGAPFFVTSPNGGETLNRSAPANVTWSVGGGVVAPTIDILLSEDGGMTWFPVALGVANDGSHPVSLPGTGTITTCRLKLAAVGNIFYDVSNADFTVTGAPVSVEPRVPQGVTLWPPEPNPSSLGLRIRFELPDAQRVNLAVYTVQGRRLRTLSHRVWPAGRHSVSWDGADADGKPMGAGVYFLRLDVRGHRVTQRLVRME